MRASPEETRYSPLLSHVLAVWKTFLQYLDHLYKAKQHPMHLQCADIVQNEINGTEE